MSSDSAHLISWPECVGTLTVDGQTAAVRCSITCDPHGQVVVRFGGIPLSPELRGLVRAFHTEEYTSHLAVEASDGTRLSGENLLFTSVGTATTDDGHMLELVAQPTAVTAEFTFSRSSTSDDFGMVLYHTVGMLGYAGVRGECEEGEVVLGGPTKLGDFESIAGHIAFRRPQNQMTLGEWITACDKRASSILRMASFGLGRSIGWSVRSVYLHGVLQQMHFVGPIRHSSPAEPPFHFLSLQPALDLALSRHELLSDQTAGIGEAIDWLTPWNTFAEVRFLSAMTAFECLLGRNEHQLNTLLNRDTFRRIVRPELMSVLRSEGLCQRLNALPAGSEPSPVSAALEEFEAKLGNLNQRSLSTRLEAFLTHYQVPMSDIPLPISSIISARHRVVHGARGRGSADDVTVTSHAAAIRELLRRTILAMLGHRRYFRSYVGMTGWLEFRDPLARTT